MWSDLTSTLSRKIRLVFSSLPQTLRNRTVCFQTIRASRQTKLRERPRERDDGARTSEPQRCTSSLIFSRCVMKSKYKFSSFVLSLSLSLFLPQCPSRSLVGCVRQRTGPSPKKNSKNPLTAAGPCRIPPISSPSWAYPFARFLDFAAWCIFVCNVLTPPAPVGREKR